MKFANKTHKCILGDIHEEVIRRIDSHDSSIRSTYEEGWMNAMSLAEDIINKWFTAQKKAEETDLSKVDVPAPQAPSTSKPKIKGVVVLVRGKPIYQPIETVDKPAAKHTDNSIDHPDYYNTGKIEVIDFVEDQKLGFYLGNAVKYICRAGKKDPHKTVEDLKKAVWYINRYIHLVLDTPDPEVSRHD